MGTRHVQTLRGFGRFDNRFRRANVLEASASYTEAGPRPGLPRPQGTARVVARVHNAQTQDAEVRISRQGYPGPDSASAAYRVGSESTDDDWRGHITPNVITDHAVVEWTTTNDHSIHDICTLPQSQRPLCIYIDDTAELWKSRVWDYTATAWGSAVTADTETVDAVGNDYPVALCAIAEDHVLAFVFFGDGSVDPSTAILRTSDQGSTWSRTAVDVLGDSSPTWAPRARMAYQPRSGQLVLVIPFEQSAGVWWLRQWASSDLGGTWALVDDVEVDTDGIFALAARPAGGFVLCYFDAGQVRQRRIADALDSFERSPAETVSTEAVSELETAVDADGKIELIGRDATNPHQWHQWVSIDGAASWTKRTYAAHDSRDSTDYIDTLAATFALGRLWVNYCNKTAGGASSEHSLMTLVAGGWQQWTNNRATFGGSLLSGRWGSGHTTEAGLNVMHSLLPFTPFAISLSSIVVTKTGSASDTVADGAHNVVASAGEQFYVTASPAAGRIVWAGLVWCDSGHALSNWMRIWCKGGNRAIYVRYDRARFELWDNDSSQIGSRINVDLTEPMWVVVERGSANNFSVTYWRPWSTTSTTIRGTLGQAAGGGQEIGWGSNTPQAIDTFYGPVWFGSLLTGGGAGDAADARFGVVRGASAHGKALGTTPYPVPDLGTLGDSGATPSSAFVSLQGGPAGVGDIIDIDAEHAYPLERIFPADEQDLVEWRTETDAATSTPAEQLIPVELAGGSNTGLGSSSILWPLIGVNFPNAYLEGYNGSTYDVLATWDATVDFSGLTCAVDGDVVTPAAATAAAARFIQQGELAGGYIASNSGTVISKISSCESGVWAGSGTAAKKALLRAAGVTAGACELWAHSGIVVVHDVDLSGYEHYRIRIPSQQTAEGYFKAQSLAPAAFKVLGREWDWAWTRNHEPVVRATGGGRRSERREHLRPTPRVVTIANADGYLLHHLRGSSPAPNYLAADAGPPLATAEEVPISMPALMEEVAGGPLIFASSVPSVDAVITDPTLWMYCQFGSGAPIENVRGAEGENEHQRLQAVTLVEITTATEAQP